MPPVNHLGCMPVWVDDILADESCSMMTNEEFGAYLRLLFRQFREGSIPADPKKISRLLGMGDDADFAELLPAVMAKFTPDPEHPDRLINPKCARVRDEVIEKAERARRGAKKRWNHNPNNDRDEDATHMHRICNASKSHMLPLNTDHRSHISNTKDSVRESPPAPAPSRSENDLPPGFARFWEAWPKSDRKRNRSGCLAKWKRERLEGAVDEVIGGLEAWKASREWTKEGGRFIPLPLTWLNQRLWEDKPEPGSGGQSIPGRPKQIMPKPLSEIRFLTIEERDAALAAERERK